MKATGIIRRIDELGRIGEYFFKITPPSLSVNISKGSPSLNLNVVTNGWMNLPTPINILFIEAMGL